MTKKRIVLPVDHYVSRSPLLGSAVVYMALDLYHAPAWLWGVMVALMLMLWIGWGVIVWQQEVKPLPGYGEQGE